jgi:acetyl-CoA C-acetyltransferase
VRHILQDDIVILSAARTPVGRFRGSLCDFEAIDLGALAIGAAVQKAGLAPDQIDTVNMGMVVSAGLGEAGAKAAAQKAGLPPTIHSRLIDSVCGSALDAAAWGIESLLLGTAGIVVAGGMESRSNAPYLLRARFLKDSPNYRQGEFLRLKRYGAYRFRLKENVEEQMRAAELIDPTTHDGLFWPSERKFMREYALDFALRQGYTLEQVNRAAAESHRKAREATAQGLFRDEIVPAGEVADDELLSDEACQRELTENPDDICSLYNSSNPSDNASAAVLTTGRRAAELGLTPMARVLGYARLDGPAEEFLSAPVRAAQDLLEALGRDGFTIVEANEAFGVQLPLFEEAFAGMQLNVHGGAIAFGHPLGSAGVRILTTLLHAMVRYGHRRGLACICYGGGGGYAIAVER